MEILIVCLAIAAIVIMYRFLPISPESSGIRLFLPLRLMDFVLIGVSLFCAVVLYIPILARVPDDQRLLQLFSPDFSIQTALVQEMVERGSFDLNIPAYLEQPMKEVNNWRFSYGALHINLSIAINRFIALFVKPSYGTIAKVHASLLLLGLFSTLILLYLWGRSLGGRFCGFAAMLVYILPYKVMFLVVHACSPDHIQQALLFGGLFSCAVLARGANLRVALAAAVLAGLAFGAKFAGVFLLPLIIGAVFVKRESRNGFLCVRRLVFLLAVIGTGFILGFIASNPQALLHPTYFAESFLSKAKLLNYAHYFSNGLLYNNYWRLFWERFLFFDIPLSLLILTGLFFYFLGLWQNRVEANNILMLVGGVWFILFTAVLLFAMRYAEPGVFIPVWPIMALAAGLAIVELWHLFGRFFYVKGRLISAVFSSVILITLLFHEIVNQRAAFSPVRTDRPLLFNINHPFYDGVKNLAGFLARYSPSTRIVVDYTQIYVPGTFQNVLYLSAFFAGKISRDILDSIDVFILSRSDVEFESALSESYYDKDAVSASRSLYAKIRTGGKFIKVGEFNYPSGWLGSRVEVWERKSNGNDSQIY